MKATELRIGNYVYLTDKKKNYQIWTAHDIEECQDYPEGSSPILLSREWFLWFGFEDGDFCGMCVQYIKNSIMIIHDTINDIWLVDNVRGVKLYIKHVHQLQNLYFALTLEDLNLKS